MYREDRRLHCERHPLAELTRIAVIQMRCKAGQFCENVIEARVESPRVLELSEQCVEQRRAPLDRAQYIKSDHIA